VRVAVTQRIQQDGQWRDGDTSFLKVNVWRCQAEHLADSIRARSGHLEDAPTRKTAKAFLMLGSVELHRSRFSWTPDRQG
jgi:hypothetical protein